MAVLAGEVRMRVWMMVMRASRVRVRPVRVLVRGVVRRRRRLGARRRLGVRRLLDRVSLWRGTVGIGAAGAQQCPEAGA